ncbi:MAG: hypothetical protein IH942_03330 [Acidobacteria bacterium]|nr:hypothetical protein [Acidobacteriota bacterium]
MIGIIDVGLVVPAAVAAGIGLRRGAPWAREAAYVVIGWFALVPAAVAAMAITMQVNGNPNATTGATVLFGVAAIVLTVGAVILYRPLFQPRRPRHSQITNTSPARVRSMGER